MAHWDEQRDARRVRMMRELRQTPEREWIIDLYENTGDLIYWSAFIEVLRAEKRAT